MKAADCDGQVLNESSREVNKLDMPDDTTKYIKQLFKYQNRFSGTTSMTASGQKLWGDSEDTGLQARLHLYYQACEAGVSKDQYFFCEQASSDHCWW